MEASRQSNRDTGSSDIESGGDEMVRASQQAYEYRGNQPKSTLELIDWHSKAEPSEALEPELPIVDCHHHLFGAPTDRLFYQLEDLHRDLNSGHQVIGTVYVEAYESGWRTTGPVALHPVGEVETIAAATAASHPGSRSDCRVAAGIVGFADLELGPAVEEVLEAEKNAAQGRLRGIRYRVAWDDGSIAQVIKSQPRPHLLADPRFRQGVASVASAGLCFETWIYHTQIEELLELADACPEVTIIICHLASPIGIGEYRQSAAQTFREWKAGILSLAKRPNLRMKLGGLGMPLFGFAFDVNPRPAQAHDLLSAWAPYLETCIAAFGTHRCMFESNFPVDKQSCSYVELWNAYKLFTRDFSLHERADLFYRSACTTYNLSELQAVGDDRMGI
jgi:L-fuconolactonase